MAKEDLIVGLDIGTTKICAIIAERTEGEPLKIVGVGTARSEGLRRGVVVNIEKTVQSITKAIEEAELMAGVEVRGVYAGIAGDHIRSINSKGVIAVSREHTDITREDVRPGDRGRQGRPYPDGARDDPCHPPGVHHR